MRTPRKKNRTSRSRSNRRTRPRSRRPKLRGGTTILDIVAPLLRPNLPYYREHADDRSDGEIYRVEAIDPRFVTSRFSIRQLENSSLAQWQGLDLAVLYKVYRLGKGTLDDVISDLVTPAEFTEQVITTIKHELTLPLMSSPSLSTHSAHNDPEMQTRIDTRAALLGMLPGLNRIKGLCRYAPDTAEKLGLDPDNEFRPKAISYSRDPELLRYTDRDPRPRVARLAGEIKRARLQDYDALRCTPDLDPQRDARRAAFRAFLDHQLPTRDPLLHTGVVCSLVHGGIGHTQGEGFQTWTIPPGKSLIMVTMATPACVNMTTAFRSGMSRFYKTPLVRQVRHIINSMLETYHRNGILVDPMDFAENVHILNEMNDGKRSFYESPNIKDVAEMAFRAQCRPVRITYFKAGDACIEKGLQVSKLEMESCFEEGTDLIVAGAREHLTPPILVGSTHVNFCLSETIENVYRRGYTNVVMYDFSCSSLTLRNTAGRPLGEAHGGPVSVALQRSGLAGGAGAR